MALKSGNKRTATPAQQGSSKKRKVSQKGAVPAQGEKAARGKQSKGKEKASDKGFVPIPTRDDDVDLSDEDVGMLKEYGGAIAFLKTLDEKGITRSKKETERLHRMHKPARVAVEDDLPSVDSHDEDEEELDWSSGIEDSDGESSGLSQAETSSSSSSSARRKPKHRSTSDEEMPYEVLPRKRRQSWEPESDKEEAIERLPIKLADGRVQKSNDKVYLPKGQVDREGDSEEDQSDDEVTLEPMHKVEDVSTGARFGRPAVVDVIANQSRKARIQGAKEQIAGLCQEIVSDPENSLGLLRRLHTFSLPEISTPTHPEPVVNDIVIRKLTILSQLAVFKDIIPGYRIRALTDKEQAEKVSQMVQRTRDWEQGLVGVYQTYLRLLEAEIKARTELTEVALRSMCSLLVEATHFNFRVNLMNTVVAFISRKSWDELSDLCLNSIIKVFRADNTGEASLEIIRLMNRMIKERKFDVNPNVLSCLLHLRLKIELGIRASESKADKEMPGKTQNRGRSKNKKTDQPHLSKKAKKMLKERQEIEKEMREAATEVDKEERAVMQTETLKLLFVLYFRILKNPHPTPLLPAALRGISKFSHLVNIDFFKDLMHVLKNIMSRDQSEKSDPDHTDHDTEHTTHVQQQLLCIVTAFELLSGQGEALDIDLSDFVNHLYVIIPSLSTAHDLESVPKSSFKSDIRSANPDTTADMLFRALHLAFMPRAASAAPPWRAAAFAKRLLTAALHYTSATACRALEFIAVLLERYPQLEALLSTEDRAGNGIYRPELDDPQLSNPFGTTFWELHLLAHRHWDARVREHAGKLMRPAQ